MEDKIKSQNLILEDRERLSISGVEHVESFNENQIIVDTARGSLVIKGESLNISKLNLEDGNVKIEGMIESLIYSNKSSSSSKGNGFLGKMFK
ncbi:sporulation protein YabP [Clostridium sp. D2Q-11]|uniref:Sporulation protein YabP n=1 Tax=Anaeromonas frigoriresistens TaxID=2683708 RepID=A0A942UTB6_9FIRM|nr:sporulation protein YabP [Anaeromonas frigoriresistens]MBS4537585.1 sporulation protein YabP [Anaeromonas frigoriresistens]